MNLNVKLLLVKPYWSIYMGDILITLAWMILWIWALFMLAVGLAHLAYYLLKDRE